MDKRVYLLALFLFFSGMIQAVYAQELNARVEILSPQLPHTNKRVLDVLQRVMTDFLNKRSWSGNQVQPHERIDCSFVITINSWDGSSEFAAQAQIMSVRPVFNTSYSSPVVNIMDKDFNFSYVEGQMVEYSDQQFMSNLTSLLAYYAYLIVGMDADTFSPLGGAPFYTAAQQVVNQAQNSGHTGWRFMDGYSNRYWLITNLHDRRYLPLRNFLYEFSRNGLDLMAEHPEQSRRKVLDLTGDLKSLDRMGQGAVLDQIFFTAKANELVGVLSGLPPQERIQAYNLLVSIDPANANKYETLRNR